MFYIVDQAKTFGVTDDLVNYAKAKLSAFAAENLLGWGHKKDFKTLMEKSQAYYPYVSKRYHLFYLLRHFPEALLVLKRWENFLNTKCPHFYINVLKILRLYSGNI